MRGVTTKADDRLLKLRADIEALANCYDYSGRALNMFGIPHTCVVNGFVKEEAEPSAPWRDLEKACINTLETAKALRGAISGDCVLFWRVLPQVEEADGKRKLYTRFSFAPWATPVPHLGDEGDAAPYGLDWSWNSKTPCPGCGATDPTVDGQDPCIANLPGVKAACCGHGGSGAYAHFTNGKTIRGRFDQ